MDIVKKDDVVAALKQCFDPEIPVDIYDLGLVYEIKITGDSVKILMTLTSPFCPVTDLLIEQVKRNVEDIGKAKSVDVEITFDPPWDTSKMSEEAKAQLGV